MLKSRRLKKRNASRLKLKRKLNKNGLPKKKLKRLSGNESEKKIFDYRKRLRKESGK